nr:carboxylesterase family protein [Actinomadura bangladeshensis]
MAAHPLDALRQGAGASVPLLTGWNREEARFFMVASGAIDAVDDAALRDAARGYGLPDGGLEVYRGNRPGASPGDVLAAIFGERMFAVPAIRVAEARAEPAVTWVYRFDHPGDRSNHGFGAAHAAELPYVFDTWTRTSSSGTRRRATSPTPCTAPGSASSARGIRDGAPTVRTTGGWASTPTACARRPTPAGAERRAWDGVC